MAEKKYFWYIPGDNKIVQEYGTFSCTGLFGSRSAAVEYIQQAELSRPPDEVYLIEADIREREEAAVHVGHDWKNNEADTDESATGHDENVNESSSEDDDRLSDNTVWHSKTITENIEFLIEQSQSDDLEIQTEVVSSLKSYIEDGNVTLDQEGAAELCSVLAKDRSKWNDECKAAADEVIAEISESYPDLTEAVVDTLVRDLDDALSKQIENHPGYGMVKIPPYGEPAAIALSHYAAWRESAPHSFVEAVAEPGRRKRATFLISFIIDIYPGFIKELYEYSCVNEDSRYKKYGLLGVVAGSEHEVANEAWEMLLNDVHAINERELHSVLFGIRKATRSRPDRVDVVTRFLNILQDAHHNKQIQRDIRMILANVVEGQPEIVTELWEYITVDDNYRDSVQAEIVKALVNTLGDGTAHLSHPEQIVSLLHSKPRHVAKPLSSLLVTAFEDEPRKLVDAAPELQEMISPRNADKTLENLLQVLLTVAKDSPETINTEQILTLIDHDSNKVRQYACDIIGYAGTPAEYDVLKEIKQEDPSEEVQHTAGHAIIRLEARFDEAKLE